MKQMSVFQIVVLCIFGALAAGGVAVFALFVGGDQRASLGPVTIWGTFDDRSMESVLQTLSETDESLKSVTYVRKETATFSDELTQALASGTGPDAYILRHDYAYLDRKKILPFAPETVNTIVYQNAFVDAANSFVFPEGVMALPIIADPLVLYWNKDLLAAGGFASAPRYWDELFDITKVITGCYSAGSSRESIVKGCDQSTLSIQKATVALGSFSNVTHAKDILASIIMQIGGSVTRREPAGDLVSALVNRSGTGVNVTESALRFFTDFSDPAKETYTWNSAQRDSRSAFVAGDLALYIGYASEASVLQDANPNLNIGISALPQVRDSGRVVTLARVYGIAVTRTSKNPQGAAVVALKLAQQYASSLFAQAFSVVSARRDVLALGGEGHQALFASTTIAARSWVDPHPVKTDSAFRAMIEGVVSGTTRITEAVARADQEIKAAIDL